MQLDAEWLGYVLDFDKNCFYIKEDRVCRLEKVLAQALNQIRLDNFSLIPVKFLASVVGQIISLQFLIGNIVRMHTRCM